MQKFRSWFKLYFRETDKLLFFLCLCASAFGMLLVYSSNKKWRDQADPLRAANHDYRSGGRFDPLPADFVSRL